MSASNLHSKVPKPHKTTRFRPGVGDESHRAPKVAEDSGQCIGGPAQLTGSIGSIVAEAQTLALSPRCGVLHPHFAAWARSISHHKKFLDWSRIC
jgi:hypothetical protein